jgi:hypothetical protein
VTEEGHTCTINGPSILTLQGLRAARPMVEATCSCGWSSGPKWWHCHAERAFAEHWQKCNPPISDQERLQAIYQRWLDSQKPLGGG